MVASERIRRRSVDVTGAVPARASAIAGQLQRTGDTALSVTIEVEADSKEGFSDEVRRTDTENARTLRFDVQEFE